MKDLLGALCGKSALAQVELVGRLFLVGIVFDRALGGRHAELLRVDLRGKVEEDTVDIVQRQVALVGQ